MTQNATNISPLVLHHGNPESTLLPQICSTKKRSLFKTGSTNAINLHGTSYGAGSLPATTVQPNGREQRGRHIPVLLHPLPSASDQANMEIQKNREYLFFPQVPYVVSRTIQKKNKTNQERLMNKNNRLSAFLLVISPPQTAVMQKVLKFKSHLSLTSADRLPMQ